MDVDVARVLFAEDVWGEGQESQGAFMSQLLVDDLVLDCDNGRRAVVAGPRVVVEGEDESSEGGERPTRDKDPILGS